MQVPIVLHQLIVIIIIIVVKHQIIRLYCSHLLAAEIPFIENLYLILNSQYLAFMKMLTILIKNQHFLTIMILHLEHLNDVLFNKINQFQIHLLQGAYLSFQRFPILPCYFFSALFSGLFQVNQFLNQFVELFQVSKGLFLQI